MKKRIQAILLLAMLCIFVLNSSAQSESNRKNEIPDWVCGEGYWVVESNVKNPKQHTVFFYNNQNLRIGRKDLSGVKLNLRRAKTKRMLKNFLEASLIAWKAGKSSEMASGK